MRISGESPPFRPEFFLLLTGHGNKISNSFVDSLFRRGLADVTCATLRTCRKMYRLSESRFKGVYLCAYFEYCH